MILRHGFPQGQRLPLWFDFVHALGFLFLTVAFWLFVIGWVCPCGLCSCYFLYIYILVFVALKYHLVFVFIVIFLTLSHFSFPTVTDFLLCWRLCLCIVSFISSMTISLFSLVIFIYHSLFLDLFPFFSASSVCSCFCLFCSCFILLCSCLWVILLLIFIYTVSVF